jgi:hypothetical protein
MSICLIAGGKAVAFAAAAFTLSWTHSVEKTRWEEDWRLTSSGLRLVEARIEGSGAGMEVPDGAVLKDGQWTYVPNLPAQKSLLLAQSGATGGGWELCAEGKCRMVGVTPGGPAEIRACRDGDAPIDQ